MPQKQQEILAGGQYNAAPATLADGQATALQFDSKGNVKVAVGGGSGPSGSTPISGVTSTGMATNQVLVGTATAPAVTILPANPLRTGAIIINNDTTPLFIGGSSAVTSTSGAYIAPNGGSLNIDIPLYVNGVFGVRAATSGVASYIEFTP